MFEPPNVYYIYFPGTIGGDYHNDEGGGSNFLCLPHDPEYSKHVQVETEDKRARARISGVEFEYIEDFKKLFTLPKKKTGLENDHPTALCSVCQTHAKLNVLMIPARIHCPSGWTREYQGYLMATQQYMKRTEYICVDHKPDISKGAGQWNKGGLLHFVETSCGVLECHKRVKGKYRENWEVTCVVCSR